MLPSLAIPRLNVSQFLVWEDVEMSDGPSPAKRVKATNETSIEIFHTEKLDYPPVKSAWPEEFQNVVFGLQPQCIEAHMGELLDCS